MKKLTDEQVIKKWSPVLETLNFKNEVDRNKACIYADLHALSEVKAKETLLQYPEMNAASPIIGAPLTENLLPISLKVLEGINDLSKVHFTGSPAFMILRNGGYEAETVGAHSISILIDYDMYMDMIRQTGIDSIVHLESAIIHELSHHINEILEKGNEIHMYLAVAGLRIIFMDGDKDKKPHGQLSLISRYHVEPTSVTINDL